MAKGDVETMRAFTVETSEAGFVDEEELLGQRVRIELFASPIVERFSGGECIGKRQRVSVAMTDGGARGVLF